MRLAFVLLAVVLLAVVAATWIVLVFTGVAVNP